MDIFIYYRVYPLHAKQCHASIFTMQKQLQEKYGIQTSLKSRVDEADKTHHPTWMEIYSHVPAGFVEILEQAVVAAKVNTYIDGTRHIEVFEELPACA